MAEGTIRTSEAASARLAELVEADAKAAVAADGALHVADGIRARTL
ncbi:hypothetical protein [Olsenella sp. Marseille-P4559]|nr:hypothetical protein [Olsenella sp. Marseille-P4559]